MTVSPAHLRRRALGNWVNLSTPLGLLVARLGGARIRRGPHRLWLAEGYRPGFPMASAFTIGSAVITARTFGTLLAANPSLLDHEERHADQWLACLGLPFLPAYLVAMGWSWIRTRDRAAANVFEVRAGLAAGGYRASRRAERAR